ncbi:MAG: hypothetical protein FWD93_01030 [Coriobacteriia bacterium]|nr:hypothetical protein [Coriobacteriia bacterium]
MSTVKLNIELNFDLEQPRIRQLLDAFRKALSEQLTDNQALDLPARFRKVWHADRLQDLDVGELIDFEGIVYRVVQAHTTQADWRPSDTPALFTPLGTEDNALDEFPDWRQPTGAHDAYSIGDRVTFHGARFESLINGNIWSPVAHPAGWKIVE